MDKTNHPGGLRLTERAVQLSGILPPACVLDVGSGMNETVEFLNKSGFSAVGIEKNAENLPFDAETFEAILFECVLSCLENPALALMEAYRVMKREGILIISDVYDKTSPGSIEKMLCENGFEPFYCEDHTPALITYIAELRENPRPTYFSGDFRKIGYLMMLGNKK
jgi:ubiquinone/menaquinone biosynthesis C-methylase UbiE